MDDLQPDPNTCNECGLQKTTPRRFLWWRWDAQHFCRPFSPEALAARQRWVIKCIMHYHPKDDAVYQWALSQKAVNDQ